ncbi:MAG: hypothetical protein WC839_01295 [Candidatus Paceibacterota bacterium]
METSKENNLLFFILILFAIEAIFFSIGNNKLELQYKNEENKIAKIYDTFSNIPIEAKAISIYDETLNRKIYGRNDNIKMPIASLTKIMSTIVVLNNHKMDDVISISKEAVKQEGDYGFFVNEKFKIRDLAKFTLVGSANDGAYAFSENNNSFLEKMNNKALMIGMENTSFFNFTGLDIDEENVGAYSSANDVNIMAIYGFKLYPEIFSASILPEITIKSEDGFEHKIKNTDVILDKILNILFSKTGYTPLAGGNLTIIYKNQYDHNIAITVLGSTREGRFSDIEKIIDTLYKVDL